MKKEFSIVLVALFAVILLTSATFSGLRSFTIPEANAKLSDNNKNEKPDKKEANKPKSDQVKKEKEDKKSGDKRRGGDAKKKDSKDKNKTEAKHQDKAKKTSSDKGKKKEKNDAKVKHKDKQAKSKGKLKNKDKQAKQDKAKAKHKNKEAKLKHQDKQAKSKGKNKIKDKQDKAKAKGKLKHQDKQERKLAKDQDKPNEKNKNGKDNTKLHTLKEQKSQKKSSTVEDPDPSATTNTAATSNLLQSTSGVQTSDPITATAAELKQNGLKGEQQRQQHFQDQIARKFQSLSEDLQQIASVVIDVAHQVVEKASETDKFGKIPPSVLDHVVTLSLLKPITTLTDRATFVADLTNTVIVINGVNKELAKVNQRLGVQVDPISIDTTQPPPPPPTELPACGDLSGQITESCQTINSDGSSVTCEQNPVLAKVVRCDVKNSEGNVTATYAYVDGKLGSICTTRFDEAGAQCQFF